MNIENITLIKGTNKEDVNKLISKWLTLEDDIYMGNNYKHNWKCKCGNIIEGRMWDKIKSRNSILCKECLYNNKKIKHKNRIEDMCEFTYIDSYFSGDILPDNTIVKRESYVKVKHNYCGNIYIVKKTKFIKTKKMSKMLWFL